MKEDKYLDYLHSVAMEHNRIFNSNLTAGFLQKELPASFVHGIETTVTCALLMELRNILYQPTIVINNATEPNEAQAALDPLGR